VRVWRSLERRAGIRQIARMPFGQCWKLRGRMSINRWCALDERQHTVYGRSRPPARPGTPGIARRLALQWGDVADAGSRASVTGAPKRRTERGAQTGISHWCSDDAGTRTNPSRGFHRQRRPRFQPIRSKCFALAFQRLVQTENAIDPAVDVAALTRIMMESTIAMSKLDATPAKLGRSPAPAAPR